MKLIIAKSTLRSFWEKHADSEQYLKTWYETAKTSSWKSPNDIKKTYANASIVANNRVVFNIKGNAYRLIVQLIMSGNGLLFGLLARIPSMIK